MLRCGDEPDSVETGKYFELQEKLLFHSKELVLGGGALQ